MAPDAGDRDAAGRFRPGWKGGPGRPKAATERGYLLVAAGACSPEDWAAIVARAVEDAKQGDAAARTWITNVLLSRDPPKLSRVLPADDPASA